MPIPGMLARGAPPAGQRHLAYSTGERDAMAFVWVTDGMVVADPSGLSCPFELSIGEPLRVRTLQALPATQRGLDLVTGLGEAIFARHPQVTGLHLDGPSWQPVLPALDRQGLLNDGADDPQPILTAARLFAFAPLWIGSRAGSLLPSERSLLEGKVEGCSTVQGHPRRPPKPQGRLYSRYIPWLDGILTFDAADHDDLDLLHRWMNDPRVAEYWKEAGTRDHHRAYLARMLADPHMQPMVCRFDGEAFGYFELYWAKEDVIGGVYPAGAYDRGFHVLIGEEGFRGKPWLTAWMTSVLHLMFLEEARTQVVVGEPQADHHRQIRNLLRSGFCEIATADLPGKRAAIVALSRERFFGDRLWNPAG